jgi:hypothetical protein
MAFHFSEGSTFNPLPTPFQNYSSFWTDPLLAPLYKHINTQHLDIASSMLHIRTHICVHVLLWRCRFSHSAVFSKVAPEQWTATEHALSKVLQAAATVTRCFILRANRAGIRCGMTLYKIREAFATEQMHPPFQASGPSLGHAAIDEHIVPGPLHKCAVLLRKWTMHQ